ncbi:MAG: hypothetical protein Q7T03_11020 [Deltaproteobacteria bacterium]|nr:hypothetical protein [Deltaproteobacteria bacterium]
MNIRPSSNHSVNNFTSQSNRIDTYSFPAPFKGNLAQQVPDSKRQKQSEEFKAALHHSDFTEADRIDGKYHFSPNEKLSLCREAFHFFFQQGNYIEAANVTGYDSPNMETEYQDVFQAVCKDAYKQTMMGGDLDKGVKIADHCQLGPQDRKSVCPDAYREMMTKGRLDVGAQLAAYCQWDKAYEKTFIESFIDGFAESNMDLALQIAGGYQLYYKVESLTKKKAELEAKKAREEEKERKVREEEEALTERRLLRTRACNTLCEGGDPNPTHSRWIPIVTLLDCTCMPYQKAIARHGAESEARRAIDELIRTGKNWEALQLSESYSSMNYRLEELRKYQADKLAREQRAQDKVNDEQAKLKVQEALKKKREDQENRLAAKRTARKDKVKEVAAAQQAAIDADDEQQENFIVDLVHANFSEAKRLIKSSWDIRSLVNRALQRATTFPIDSCDKAELIRSEFKSVEGLCTPKRTSITEKLDGSCKLECRGS